MGISLTMMIENSNGSDDVWNHQLVDVEQRKLFFESSTDEIAFRRATTCDGQRQKPKSLGYWKIRRETGQRSRFL